MSDFGVARFAENIKRQTAKECARCPNLVEENQEKLVKARRAARRTEY